MTFLRKHAAVELSPILRPDGTQAHALFCDHFKDIAPFEGSFVIYVDIDMVVTRTILDALNHMASRLPEGYRVNQTPVRSFATAPYRKRVTLVVELPFEPPNTWEVIDTIWCGLFRVVRWGTNQIIVGPLVLYERIVSHALLLVTAESLNYSTDKGVWAHIAGGVPVSPTKALWKLEAQTDRDAFIFAIEDWNDQAVE